MGEGGTLRTPRNNEEPPREPTGERKTTVFERLMELRSLDQRYEDFLNEVKALLRSYLPSDMQNAACDDALGKALRERIYEASPAARGILGRFLHHSEPAKVALEIASLLIARSKHEELTNMARIRSS